MKKSLSVIALVGTFAFLSAQSISFDKTTWEYGTIKQGADGHRVFTVKNTGDKPLILSKVKASCGCTVPSWDKKPIAPGKTAKIKVGYNTSRAGSFRKLIEVFSNDPKHSRSVLYITGNVEGGKKVAKKVKRLTPLQKAENNVKNYTFRVERMEKNLEKAKKVLKKSKKELKRAQKKLKRAQKKLRKTQKKKN